eukprot:1334128-Rhodomonas_salina.3
MQARTIAASPSSAAECRSRAPASLSAATTSLCSSSIANRRAVLKSPPPTHTICLLDGLFEVQFRPSKHAVQAHVEQTERPELHCVKRILAELCLLLLIVAGCWPGRCSSLRDGTLAAPQQPQGNPFQLLLGQVSQTLKRVQTLGLLVQEWIAATAARHIVESFLGQQRRYVQ